MKCDMKQILNILLIIIGILSYMHSDFDQANFEAFVFVFTVIIYAVFSIFVINNEFGND